MTMLRTSSQWSAFAAFVVGAWLVSLPYWALIVSWNVTERRIARFECCSQAHKAGPEDNRCSDGLVGSTQGAPIGHADSADSLLRTAGPNAGDETDRDLIARYPSTCVTLGRDRELVRWSRFDHSIRLLRDNGQTLAGSVASASAQAQAFAPRDVGTSRSQSMKSRCLFSDAGSTPAASTIMGKARAIGVASMESGSIPLRSVHHGGDPVSTGSERAMETAEEHPRKSEQTIKRQLRVAEGGLTAPEDAGSPRHQNQPYSHARATTQAAPSGLARKSGEAPPMEQMALLYEIKYGMAIAAAELCGVEPGLVIAVALRESGMLWPERKHDAVGYMQVKPSTARGVSRTLDPFTAWGNFVSGACYLRTMYDRTGSWREAVHRYTVGPVGRVTERTRAYADDIMGDIE